MSLTSAKKPLEGLRVLDFTSMIAGPYCTRLLADTGAEVIKIEPDRGDHMRHTPPQRDGRSSYFGYLNAGKKSVVLDLKSDTGREQAIALAKSSDILVENFRPGVMSSLGLGYGEVANEHSDLIYCSISGFGQTGPRAQQPAYAPIIHAVSGYDLTQLEYQDQLTRPENCGIFIADFLAAIFGFGAIQTAMIHRLRHGGGQFIDVALMDAMINIMVFESHLMQFAGSLKRNFFEPSKTKDGFVIITPITQKNFEAIANAMDHPEWITDPRFQTIYTRRENWRDLMDAMESWTLGRGSIECEEYLIAAGVPCGRYRLIEEAMTDPQVLARNLFFTAADGSGQFQMSNPPFQFSSGTVGAANTVTDLGADTEAVLAGLE